MQSADRGKLVSWKPDKAFGFIRPDSGGKDVFVHLRDFGTLPRPPKVGDVIRYQRISDGAGRHRAADVHIDGLSRLPSTRRPGKPRTMRSQVRRRELAAMSVAVAAIIVAAFSCVLIALVAVGNLSILIPVLYIVASLLAFLLYAFDKAAALNQRWRTRESTLHLTNLAGGWPGALIAQGMFRHKSRKLEYLATFWCTVAVNCAFLYWAATKSGAAFIRGLVY